MKYLLIVAGLFISASAYSQEIVILKQKESKVAVVTTCKTDSRPIAVTIRKLEKGEAVLMRTADRRRHKCEVEKVVKVT